MAIASRRTVLAAIAAATVCLIGSPAAEAAVSPAAYTLPPVNAQFDYQIGGAYTPPTGVQVVSRDRTASPVAGLYNICYVNTFQVQPDEVTWWQQNHDDLLLKDANGDYVVDGDWDEILLDTSTAAKRSALASIMGTWFSGCATAGFQAIEPDNIDSYDRSDGLLTIGEAEDFLALLAPLAHGDGLAIAQKNTTDLGTAGQNAGLDFAISEECGRYSECSSYTDVYGAHLIDIEYTKAAFTKACNAIGASVSVVRRDVDVTAPGSGTYVYGAC
jgi:hypothetical protein